MPGPPQPVDRGGVGRVRGLEVAVAPVREPGQGRCPGAGEVVVVGRAADRQLGVPDGGGHVAANQCQRGAVHLDRPREAAELLLVEDDHPRRRRLRPLLVGRAVVQARSTSRSRPSTPSNSPPVINAPTRPTASTGRTRTTSSGRASSQPRIVASCRLLRRAGDGQLDQLRCAFDVPGGQRMANRRRRLPVLLVPPAGAPVQVGDLVGALVEQMGPQHVREEVVVAVPPTVVVERDHEQVGALQRLEHGLAAGLRR